MQGETICKRLFPDFDEDSMGKEKLFDMRFAIFFSQL
jgi:hypothetical protein